MVLYAVTSYNSDQQGRMLAVFSDMKAAISSIKFSFHKVRGRFTEERLIGGDVIVTAPDNQRFLVKQTHVFEGTVHL